MFIKLPFAFVVLRYVDHFTQSLSIMVTEATELDIISTVI